MKNFPALFAAQKNLKADVAPVWILKLRAGGVDYYISDNVFTITPWGVTTKNWAKAWGGISEGITGLLEEFRIATTSVTCWADPAASPNIVDLASTYNLEKDLFYLYQWYHGCADPPQEFFRGYVRDYPISEGDTVCTLQLQDETLKWERSYVGNRITLQQHPSADPDDVGKIEPVVFGTVSKLPVPAVDAGVQTSLVSGINAAAVSATVSDVRGLAAGMIVQVDSEQMQIQSVAGNVLTVVRGVNGTLAAQHQRAAMVWQQKANFFYMVSGQPVDSIPKAYAKVGQVILDISTLCTVWPAGDHPSYPGKAVIAVPGYITIEQAINLAVVDGIVVGNGTLGAGLTGNVTRAGSAALTGGVALSGGVSLSGLIALLGSINDPGHTHVTGQSTSENTTTGLPTATPPATYYQSGSQWGIVGNPNIWGLYLDFPDDAARSEASYSITLELLVNFSTYSLSLWFVVNGVSKYFNNFVGAAGSRFTVTFSAGSVDVDRVYVMSNNYGPSNWRITAASRTIQLTGLVSGANSASVSNGSLSANNGTLGVANTLGTNNTLNLSDTISIDKGTLQALLSGNVAKTGTVALSGNSVANTLVGDTILVDVTRAIAGPGTAVQEILSTWCGVASFQQVGAFPASYAFNGAITEYRLAKDIIHELAWQCRSWFSHSMGVAKLIVRSLTPASVKTLPWCRVEGGKKVHSRSKTEYGEIINVINLLYGRDWTRDKGDTAYTAVSSGTDSASITDFGHQERPELFKMDFVTSQAMADDLRAFYLAFYAVRHWAHTWETYYYDSELEFADAVKLGFAKDVLVQIQQAGLQPGSNTIQIKAIQ